MRRIESAKPFGEFLRCPSSLELSSKDFCWIGAALEQHVVDAAEREEGSIDRFILSLSLKQSAVQCEREVRRGRFVTTQILPGSMLLQPPGRLRVCRTFTSVPLLLCALDRPFLLDAWEEIREDYPSCEAIAYEDPTVYSEAATRQLLLLLAAEVKGGGIAGRLYVQYLLHALAVRLHLGFHAEAESHSAQWKLSPRHGIRHTIEKIESNPLANFDLAKLASESGYSKRQFLRLFRAKTGSSPYQYVLQLRLERARKMMANRSLHLLDIALECGFQSHAHFTGVFRQHFGIPPNAYRAQTVSGGPNPRAGTSESELEPCVRDHAGEAERACKGGRDNVAGCS